MASISRPTLHKRPVVNASNPRPNSAGQLKLDVDPPPKPPAILIIIAFGFILFLACLQLLPATHFRDPYDRHRNWIPIDPNRTETAKNEIVDKIDVYSWTDCLDLRAIAVLVNSTISNSRFPEHLHFHFIVPEGEDEKVSYYKLKVLLPNSSIDIIGQQKVKEKLRTVLPEWELISPSLHQLIPFVIPIINPSVSRFVYVSSDTIMKGNIQDLFGVDLGSFAIAAAKHCDRKLGDYVKMDVLNAIQRTAAKTWVSNEPYDMNACTLDFNVLLIDAQKLDRNLMGAIQWWTKVLDLKDERSQKINVAIALALYNRYLELPSPWKLHKSMPSEFYNETNILRYDGPTRVCLQGMKVHKGSDNSNIWQQYFNPKSEAILAH